MRRFLFWTPVGALFCGALAASVRGIPLGAPVGAWFLAPLTGSVRGILLGAPVGAWFHAPLTGSMRGKEHTDPADASEKDAPTAESIGTAR